jgi:hypothetical protein
MTALSRGETNEIEYLLTLALCLPRPDDHARNGLDARGEHTTLDTHVLHIPFRRDRLTEWDCGRNGGL